MISEPIISTNQHVAQIAEALGITSLMILANAKHTDESYVDIIIRIARNIVDNEQYLKARIAELESELSKQIPK